MIKKIGVLLALILLVSCAKVEMKESVENTGEVIPMKLTSTAFEPNGKIPSKYTCDGANINPPLAIADVPSTAKSLVLLMDDPDLPDFVKEKYKIEVWDHWVVFNVPVDTKVIAERKNLSGSLGKNTGGKNNYAGPCPPDREHRYFFKLYALDTMLELKEGAAKAQVEKAMEGHILSKAELVGRYERIK